MRIDIQEARAPRCFCTLSDIESKVFVMTALNELAADIKGLIPPFLFICSGTPLSQRTINGCNY